VHDVSDRERLQRELRTETEQLRTALRNSPLVAFRLDTDLRYTWVGNPHEDFDPAAVIGKRDDELLPLEAADVVMAPKRRVIETGEGVREEVTYELPSGRVTYDLTVEPLRDESGDLVGLTSAALDITEQKRRERQLREQNERLDRVTTVLSHDLRSPLSVATGRLTLFERDSDPAHLDDVRTALVRMSDLVDDVLATARRRGGGDERETMTVPVRGVAERAWEQVESDGASLVVETDRTVEADESRLQQLFENLLRNSVEHGSRGDERNDGRLTVRVGPLANGGFYVEDDGTGFVGTPSAVEQVFEDGYTTRPEGTGLGLGIVRDVTAEHGWTVEAVAGTETDNGGARFEFRVE
jgi:PAS domain S-box-containing protein